MCFISLSLNFSILINTFQINVFCYYGINFNLQFIEFLI